MAMVECPNRSCTTLGWIPTVQYQEIKRIQKHAAFIAAVAKHLEHGHAAFIATDGLAIDQERLGAHRVRRSRDRRITRRPIVSATGEQASAGSIAPDHHAITVVLDFVQPTRDRSAAP
jgi:hypothetical protein